MAHRCSSSVCVCVDVIVRHMPFKVHVRQGSLLLPIGIHIPPGSSPDAAVDTTVRAPCRQDTAAGLRSQAVGIGFLLQALAEQLVLALRIPAVVILTAKGHHAIAMPLCFEQAQCLLIIHPTGLTALPYQARGPRPVMMSTNSAMCTLQASLGSSACL